MKSPTENPYRLLPSVEEVLADEATAGLRARVPRPLFVAFVQELLERWRAEIGAKELDHAGLEARLAAGGVVEALTRAVEHEEKLGIRGSGSCQFFFDNFRVPVANRLGEEGEGFKAAMRTLDSGRIGIAAQAVGIGRAAHEAALAYSKERKAFGLPISQHQAIQFMLADMATELDAARPRSRTSLAWALFALAAALGLASFRAPGRARG